MNDERIEAILSAVKGPDILSLGCVGHTLPSTEQETVHWLQLHLQQRFPQASILGLDIDQANVERMHSMGFKAELGDAHHLTFESQFDTIVLGELIEHLESPGECLAGCKRALKPGGRIVISTPNAFSVMLGLMYLKNFDKAFNAEHVLWFCPQTLRTVLARCGLDLVQLEFVDNLAPELISAKSYRAFAYSWRGIRRLLPKRYRNTMVAVCQSAEIPACRESRPPAPSIAHHSDSRSACPLAISACENPSPESSRGKKVNPRAVAR
ncbi:MAG: class I SAM-dependent methyltransferase [Candidatus Acidiferrales bacterium]